jgi:hypothetical protein
MSVSLSLALKAVLGLTLLGVIVLSVRARAPRRGLHGGDLRLLVASALFLYAAGGAAWMTHHLALAVVVYGAGIVTAALAAWLSRGGSDFRDPPSEDEPAPWDPEPDWEKFERDLRDYVARTGERVGV